MTRSVAWLCLTVAVVGCRGKVVEKAQADPPLQPAAARTVAQPAKLRPLSDDELTRPLVRHAERILDERGDDPLGTEIPFVHEGKRYVARIETHYHPVGGEKRPWGPHRGVTLLTPER
jgi:hypothetical protein